MLRNTTTSLCVALICNVSVHAAVTISSTSIDTPGLPGYKTHTVTAVSEDPITAIDFVGDGSNNSPTSRGFFGPMNQLTAAGMPTPWQDFNAFLPQPDGPKQDSQFLVTSSSVVVPAGLVEENGNLLQGAWAWSVSPGNNIPFAQLVLPNTSGIFFRGAITALVGGVQTDFPVSGCAGCGFSPMVVDTNLGDTPQGSIINHTFTTSPGSRPPIVWDNLMVSGTGTPAIAPTLTSDGMFSWNSAGSPLGLYNFDVTASNLLGSDVGRLTIQLVIPEPSSMSLVSFGIVALLALRRHTRV